MPSAKHAHALFLIMFWLGYIWNHQKNTSLLELDLWLLQPLFSLHLFLFLIVPSSKDHALKQVDFPSPNFPVGIHSPPKPRTKSSIQPLVIQLHKHFPHSHPPISRLALPHSFLVLPNPYHARVSPDIPDPHTSNPSLSSFNRNPSAHPHLAELSHMAFFYIPPFCIPCRSICASVLLMYEESDFSFSDWVFRWTR